MAGKKLSEMKSFVDSLSPSPACIWAWMCISFLTTWPYYVLTATQRPWFCPPIPCVCSSLSIISARPSQRWPYESGPTGFGLARTLQAAGHRVIVAAARASHA